MFEQQRRVLSSLKGGRVRRFLIVFTLGFSSGLPMALISSTLQAWFASAGMSVMATGMLSLLSFPYVYRVIWAPIVDRYSLFSIGKRRSWIGVMQVFLLLGFNALAWCSPLQNPVLMASMAFVLACFSSMQDIAVDAHRTEYLPVSEHGMGASLAVLGYRLAILLSGGLALVMAQHWGWALTYRVLGFFMIPGLIATAFSPEPSIKISSSTSFVNAFFDPLKELLSRDRVFSFICFIFFFKLGEAFTASTSGVMMPFLIQGLGFSLETVGMVNKVMGVMSLLIGGLLSGFILMRYSLYKTLFCFGLMQALTNLLFVALAVVGQNLSLFMLAVVSDNVVAGMGTTALVALLMRVVDMRYTATQFSLLVSISALPRVLSGPTAAALYSWLGWVGVFELSFVFALMFIPFLGSIRRVMEQGPSLDVYTPSNSALGS